MNTEERGEYHTKGIENTSNTSTEVKFPNTEKGAPVRVQEPYRAMKRWNERRLPMTLAH